MASANRSPSVSATAPTDWRGDWEIREDGAKVPRVWHRSGLCFFFEIEPIDEEGGWAWVAYNDDVAESRLFELQGEAGG